MKSTVFGMRYWPSTIGRTFMSRGITTFEGSPLRPSRMWGGRLSSSGTFFSASIIAQPTYAPETKVAGGQMAVGIGIGYGKNTTEADITVSPRGTEVNRSDSVWGWTDLYPVVSLAWTSGVHNWMTYLTGDIPVGAYDSKRLANIGIGHGAIDAGGGYT